VETDSVDVEYKAVRGSKVNQEKRNSRGHPEIDQRRAFVVFPTVSGAGFRFNLQKIPSERPEEL
jgi:hypothetical protein